MRVGEPIDLVCQKEADDDHWGGVGPEAVSEQVVSKKHVYHAVEQKIKADEVLRAQRKMIYTVADKPKFYETEKYKPIQQDGVGDGEYKKPRRRFPQTVERLKKDAGLK